MATDDDVFKLPKETIVYGTAYTPESSENYSGTLFHERDMNDHFVDTLMNKPVYIEHDDEVEIGQIIGGHIDRDTKQAKVLLRVHKNDIAQMLLPEKLESGFFQELSLGNDVVTELYEDGRIQIVGNHPKEVSIVRKGDRPDTRILDWAIYDPNEMDLNTFVETRFGYINR
jgi:hypothetical protein